jgi:hypothetical protein
MQSEQVISLPVVNPETNAPSRSFVYRGKIDLVDGNRLIDWKSVDDPDKFIRQKRIGCQAELYAWAMIESGHPIDTIEYRLISRPTIKFCDARFSYAVMKEGRKTAVKVFDNRDDAERFVMLQGGSVVERVQGDRDADAYERRCLDWLLDDPMKIVTHVHHITGSKLEQAQWRLWESSKRILDNRRQNRWIPNDRACFLYQRECQYVPLCDTIQNGGNWERMIASEYRKRRSMHPELGDADKADEERSTITYSSMQDLALCEMYYQWRYERGIERAGADDGESLWIGSAMHAGLDGYAHGGLSQAFSSIASWADSNPIIGEQLARKQDEMVAKARAMVCAAEFKWPTARA